MAEWRNQQPERTSQEGPSTTAPWLEMTDLPCSATLSSRFCRMKHKRFAVHALKTSPNRMHLFNVLGQVAVQKWEPRTNRR